MHAERGVIVGSDREGEWLLPWWWHHYSSHNSYPVTFLDFGMSDPAVEWCKTKGNYLPLSTSISLQEVSEENKGMWEEVYNGGVWGNRGAWFKKPLALLLTPFPWSIWIDTDCKVRGNLEPLFESLSQGADIGLARDPAPNFCSPSVINYNAGVVVFRKNAPIIHKWAHLATHENGKFAGDQNALCHAIAEDNPLMAELPETYNWVRHRGPSDSALIYHYTGGLGKVEIYQEWVTT